MSTKKYNAEHRLVLFISDFLTPWVMRHIKDRYLKGQLIGALGSIKQMIYGRAGK